MGCRQAGRVQHERERLVDGVVGAVPEHDAGFFESGRTPAHEVGDGAKLLDRGACMRVETIVRRGHGGKPIARGFHCRISRERRRVCASRPTRHERVPGDAVVASGWTIVDLRPTADD